MQSAIRQCAVTSRRAFAYHINGNALHSSTNALHNKVLEKAEP
jgi:hypothetical protein